MAEVCVTPYKSDTTTKRKLIRPNTELETSQSVSTALPVKVMAVHAPFQKNICREFIVYLVLDLFLLYSYTALFVLQCCTSTARGETATVAFCVSGEAIQRVKHPGEFSSS